MFPFFSYFTYLFIYSFIFQIIRYLTSNDNLMSEDMLYRTSLGLEPRKRGSSKIKHQDIGN